MEFSKSRIKKTFADNQSIICRHLLSFSVTQVNIISYLVLKTKKIDARASLYWKRASLLC